MSNSLTQIFGDVSAKELKIIDGEDNIILRRATMLDAPYLYDWRMDYEARMASRNMDVFPRESHYEWLKKTLANEKQALLVAAQNGVRIGTVRFDEHEDGSYEISYTVAPEHRKKGLAVKMCALAVDQMKGLTLTAEIKPVNQASEKVAQAVGFKLVPGREVTPGFTFWEKR